MIKSKHTIAFSIALIMIAAFSYLSANRNSKYGAINNYSMGQGMEMIEQKFPNV